MALTDLQRMLVEALPQRDPAAVLRQSPSDALSPIETEAVLRVPEDGLLLTSLVIIKLRMQQLLKSPGALKQFEEDPEAFARIFERYHSDCPMADFFPEGEGARFADWLSIQSEQH